MHLTVDSAGQIEFGAQEYIIYAIIKVWKMILLCFVYLFNYMGEEQYKRTKSCNLHDIRPFRPAERNHLMFPPIIIYSSSKVKYIIQK